MTFNCKNSFFFNDMPFFLNLKLCNTLVILGMTTANRLSAKKANNSQQSTFIIYSSMSSTTIFLLYARDKLVDMFSCHNLFIRL